MKALAFVILCAACNDIDGPEFPIQPTVGSAGTSGIGFVDANVVVLVGRVCVIDNVISVNCANTGVENVVVSAANQTVVAAADGTFAFTEPFTTTSDLVFTVSGPAVVTTAQTLNARMQINVLRQTAFNNMLAFANIETVPINTGSVIATVTNAGVPVIGATATSVPVAAFGPFFDGIGPEPWTTNATGAAGIVWFPFINAGPADLSFNTLTGGEAIVGGVQVINGGITMVETPLP